MKHLLAILLTIFAFSAQAKTIVKTYPSTDTVIVIDGQCYAQLTYGNVTVYVGINSIKLEDSRRFIQQERDSITVNGEHIYGTTELGTFYGETVFPLNIQNDLLIQWNLGNVYLHIPAMDIIVPYKDVSACHW